MKTTLLTLALASVAALASAQSRSFEAPSAVRAAAQSPIPLPSPSSSDVIIQPHMLAQAGRESLFGYADTQQQFQEAFKYWSAILTSAGVIPGVPSFKDGFYVLPYTSDDGRVIRDFLADPLQFAPRDEGALRVDMDHSRQALRNAGLRPVASSVVSLPGLMPTYSLLYLTRREDSPERELRLRRLKASAAINLPLLSRRVRVVSAPKPWLVVYVGPEAAPAPLLPTEP